ncbi:MAG: hypothetical protein V3V99_08725 [candidate division Zixibacteria bacterium]
MDSMITGIAIRHRHTNRIMESKTESSEKLIEWLNSINGSVRRQYDLEMISSGKLPVGFVGRDKNFNHGMVVAIPPIPEGLKAEIETDYPISIVEGADYPVSIEQEKDLPVIKFMKRFGPELVVIAGELNYKVFPEAFKIELFRQLVFANDMVGEGHLQFMAQVVCGPIAMIKKAENRNKRKGSIIYDLVEHQDIEVFYSDKRQSEHFRMTPMAVCWEGWHAPNDPDRIGSHAYYDADKVVEFQIKKNKILSDEDIVIPCNTVQDIDDNFIFVTEDELTELVEYVNKKFPNDEKAFDKLNKLDLIPYLKDLDIPLPHKY